MIIRLQGKEYDFDPNIDVKAAVVIKNYTGHAVVPWLSAVAAADPQACQALIWVAKRQNGEATEISTIVDFSPLDVTRAFAQAVEESGGDLLSPGQADPTNGRKGSTPSSTPTSES